MSAPDPPGSPPRVCYLLKRFPRLSQTFILNELLELQRQGVGVAVVAWRDSDEPVTHPRVAELVCPVTYADEDELAGAVAATGAGHIHAHFATWGARAAMRISEETGIPYSFTAHARDIHHHSVDAAALAERIARARFVVTVSDANRRHLDGVLASQGRTGRVVRLYNGMDLSGLTPPSASREPDLVVSVGRLVEKKGFADLVTACATLRDGGSAIRLAIVGDGELREALEGQIRAAGLTGAADLLGALPQDATLQLIGRGAVFVLPCVVAADGDRDGLPTVILEAMSLGTPVVSTDLPGVPEMIEDGVSGRIVPQRDPGALAAAIADVLDDRDAATRYAHAARESLRQRFDISVNVARLAELFASGAS